MNALVDHETSPGDNRPRWQVAAEIALVFGIFFLQGAWPVPDVNEPYYLGKAIHVWNPDWAADDAFLKSAAPHQVFYFTFGRLSLWLAPAVLAWVGRLLTWGLLAWVWRRLSFAILPRRWTSILTAAMFVCLTERCNMAGEWVVGGVEAKGFAYVLVLLGLEALVRGRWNRMWLLFGAASAFHVLVGGWAVVAAGLAWLCLAKDRPALRSMGLALGGGFLLSLPGLGPSVTLNWGVDPEIVDRANVIYVFGRLGHHLAPSFFPKVFVIRFVLLSILWVVFCWIAPVDRAGRRLRAFVVGALAIALVGVAVSLATWDNPALAARCLRFYWFRLSDVAVPLGVALGGPSFLIWWLARIMESRPLTSRRRLAAVVAVLLIVAAPALHVGGYVRARCSPMPPRGDPQGEYYSAWRGTCAWAADPENVPPDARFLTPRMSQTFKWYTGRAEVGTWKDVPQDARSVVTWWAALNEIHAGGSDAPSERWHFSLADALSAMDADELRQLRTKHDIDYVLTVHWPPLNLPVVHRRGRYVIYQMPDEPPR